jgi:hypothetical protein
MAWNTSICFSKSSSATDVMIAKQIYQVIEILGLFKDPTLAHLISLKSVLFMALTIYHQIPTSKRSNLFDPNVLMANLKNCETLILKLDPAYNKSKDPIMIQSIILEIEILAVDRQWEHVLEIIKVFCFLLTIGSKRNRSSVESI